MATSFDENSRIEFEDQVSRSRFEYLVQRSATMREMMDVLVSTPGIRVRVRALSGLRDSASKSAHGMLRVDGDTVNALLEFDTFYSKLPAQLEMLAHELAHVVEVVCLPDINAKGGLRQALLARGFSIGRGTSGLIGIETRFATDVGRQVAFEALTRARNAGTLRAMARRHTLGFPCSDGDLRAVAAPAPGSR